MTETVPWWSSVLGWLFCGGAAYNVTVQGKADIPAAIMCLIGGPVLLAIRLGMLFGAIIVGTVYGKDKEEAP